MTAFVYLFLACLIHLAPAQDIHISHSTPVIVSVGGVLVGVDGAEPAYVGGLAEGREGHGLIGSVEAID